MILETGSKVLIVHRRLFEGDQARFFLGTIDGYDSNAGVAKVTGNTWIRDTFSGELLRKEDQRTKILGVANGTLIIYELPPETDLRGVKLEIEKGGRLALTDGKKLRLDLSETEHAHVQKKRI